MDIAHKQVYSIVLSAIIAAIVLFTMSLGVHAQTYDTTGVGSQDTTMYASTTGGTDMGTTSMGTTDSTTGTPGVPNTGLGGNALATITTLLSSAILAIVGMAYIRRQAVNIR